jgi:ATP phosphoribosyltransferase
MSTLKIAIQKKGRLFEDSINFLKNKGITFGNITSQLTINSDNSDVQLILLRDDDIPTYVYQKVADIGIVGENEVIEQQIDLKIIKKLEFAICKLVIASPSNSNISNINQLSGERIATSYPNTLRKFLSQNNINASIIKLEGSVEVAPSLGIADAIMDITQSGKTINDNNLKIIETIALSQAVLITNPYSTYDYNWLQ